MTMKSTDGKPIRITLVNDYEIIVKGLQRMLDPFSDRVQVVETKAGGTPDHPTDLVLFDTFAGRRHSLQRVEEMVSDHNIGRVVLYTWDAPQLFLDDAATRAVDGIILKSETGEALVATLERIHAGERVGLDGKLGSEDQSPTLSEREREVLALIAQGATNREIADELYLSIDTVKTHVRHLFSKLGVTNRTLAALKAAEHDVAPPLTRKRA
jgi:DNA-binding NarL/FixJ family response regulator